MIILGTSFTRCTATLVFTLCGMMALSQGLSLSKTYGFGGAGDNDNYNDLTYDNEGELIAVGEFSYSCDIDPGPDTLIAGSENAHNFTCIMKFDKDGNWLWSKSHELLSPTSNAEIYSVCTDHENNIIIAGRLRGDMDFDFGAGKDSQRIYGTFIQKLDPDGNHLWAIGIQGANVTYNYAAIASGPSGSIYLTGLFNGTIDFDPGPGIAEKSSTTDGIFICRFDPQGSFHWVAAVSSSADDLKPSIALDKNENVYVTGMHRNKSIDINPGTGTHWLSSKGGNDIFILKLDSNSNFIWGKSINGGGDQTAFEVSIVKDMIFISGNASAETDYDPGPEIQEGDPGLGFLVKLDLDGNYIWSFQQSIYSFTHTVSKDGFVLIGGYVNSGTFSTSLGQRIPGADIREPATILEDAFITVLDSNGKFQNLKYLRAGGKKLCHLISFIKSQKSDCIIYETAGDS